MGATLADRDDADMLLAIARGVADMRRGPAMDAEVVTQALRTSVTATPTSGEACVNSYATTVLPLLNEKQAEDKLYVALPGGSSGWVEAAVSVRPAAEPFPIAGPAVALALATRMSGAPYLWGGTTVEGVDCRGFVQLCCWAAERIIRRDADQQYTTLPYVVARGDLSAGNPIFFARDGRITHVALTLDSSRYIHAKGEPESRVLINSLDPRRAEYSQRLDARCAGARRPFTESPFQLPRNRA